MSNKVGKSRWLGRLKIVALLSGSAALVLFGILRYLDAPLREARKLLERGEPTKAVALIDSWEKKNHPVGRSQALRARCWVEMGRYEESIRLFEKCGAANADETHAWAKAYLSMSQWSQALPLLKELRSRKPEDADLLHELAACLAKLGRREEALDAARDFAMHREFSHRAYLLIGAIHLDNGNKEKALDAWTQIEKHNPEYDDLQIPSEDFLTQFASLHIELGLIEDAQRLLQQSLKINETAEAHFQAGLAADLQGDSGRAGQHWQHALKFGPYHLNSRESLARAAIASGDGAEAEFFLAPILQKEPQRSSTAYLMQRASLLQGDQQRAEKWRQTTNRLRRKEAIDSAVSQVLKDNPTSYWAAVIRAYQFAARGNSQQAQKLLESLPVTKNEDPFVTDLKEALQTRGALPAKDRIPIELF